MSDLVERLRIVDSPDYGKNISLTVRREDVSEAATALTAKDKEIEALRAKVTEQRDAMELLARKHMLLARDFDSLNARSDATRRRAETAERRVAELEKHCIRLGQGGAERYWEGRWRDEAKENDQLRRERDEAREALKPFAQGSIDASGSAVIIGYPQAYAAHRAARSLIEQGDNP